MKLIIMQESTPEIISKTKKLFIQTTFTIQPRPERGIIAQRMSSLLFDVEQFSAKQTFSIFMRDK